MGNLLQILAIIVLPIAVGGVAAWYVRRWLAGLRWNVYAAVLMLGLLTPILIGLLVAQAMISNVENAMALAAPMMAGVAAGTGWLGGALMFRFSGNNA
ncbi:hypothetical protein [Hyphobacterium sp.]|uniref:hypothetical protein n=1 Tax=Hyphobacterium sp. TaxID=2004662 RepID=UPI003BA86AC9